MEFAKVFKITLIKVSIRISKYLTLKFITKHLQNNLFKQKTALYGNPSISFLPKCMLLDHLRFAQQK